MQPTLYCVVEPQGQVRAAAEAGSGGDPARHHGPTEAESQEYEFDLELRRMSAIHGTPWGAIAAQKYFSERVGSPERLMAFAAEGPLSKPALAALLNGEARPVYLKRCARIERAYTDACAAKGDPCLESGCSVEGGDEICLQPLLEAGVEYDKACALEWIELFRDPANRLDAWKA